MNLNTRDALLVATFTAASILTTVTLACLSWHGNCDFAAASFGRYHKTLANCGNGSVYANRDIAYSSIDRRR